MQFALLLQVCVFILAPGLSEAKPGRKFLMMFPPHSDPSANLTHQVTITATGVWTAVTVQVLESSFMEHIFLSASQSKTFHLPPSTGITSDRSSHLLRVTSVWPVTVVASVCAPSGCDHSLLHDVSSWGTNYYPVTPPLPAEKAVSQMVITSSERETSVEIFLSGEVLFNGSVHPKGSVLRLHLGVLQSVYIQSNSSFSGSELNSQEAVGVVVGFTCSKHTPGYCLYGFCELKSVSHWGFDYIVPPLANTGVSYSFLMAMATINSALDVTSSTGQTNLSLIGGVMEVIPVVTSDKIEITSDGPLQLVYFQRYLDLRPSSLTVLPSVDDICTAEPMFDSGDMSKQQDNGTHTGDSKSDVKISQKPNFARPPTNADVGHYLSTLDRELYPAVCEKVVGSCSDVHCGPKKRCSMESGKPLCSLQTKICSAWGDSYYRSFNGRDFVLQGNCNYTLVQTSCQGLNASFPLQINIARAYLNSATISTIHTVQISIRDFNISLVKEDKNYVRINGQKRNLPLTLGNGSLHFHPSGPSVVLETTFGLAVRYDWKHHLQIEVDPALFGKVCGLCGNANHTSSKGVIASNGTDGDTKLDFTLPWVVSSEVGSCIEDCSGSDGASCLLCSQSQAKHFLNTKGNSFMTGCQLLQWTGGPFADCHSYIDPDPFVRSCVTNLCISEASSAVCKILGAYANMCHRLGARIRNWRTIAKCSMACPLNSHYEICGSACPATCGDPDAPRNCTLPCVESCQCNRGFLLSGGKCVLHEKCGCLHQGSYYLPNENFWVDEQCQEKCVCQPNSKTLTCSQSQCREGTMCKVLKGVLDCHVDGLGLCIAKGDPHYTTFDGLNFDVYGNCTYLLSSHCPSWGDLEDFRVEVQNQMTETSNVSIRHVKMVVSGYSIEMFNDWSNKAKVNGLLMHIPAVLSHGKVKLYMTGLSKCVETDFGVIMTFGSGVLTVQMPRIFSGTLCGLCGNFNSDPEDDIIPDEESDISVAVRHWKINSQHECHDAPIDTAGCKLEEISLYQGEHFCGRILDTEGAFQNCHEKVDPKDFFDNCVRDLCYNNQTTLCQILSSYVAVCQEMGAMVDEWRSPSFCHLLCPSNSEYHLCSTHTPNCGENSTSSTGKCKEGCFCKPDFFNSAGKCVPNSECGCIYDGVYHEVHEDFYPDDLCQMHCVCVNHNKVQCTNHTCSTGTKCMIRDGRRACHALQPLQCRVSGGRHFRNYDGHYFNFNMGSCNYVLSQSCDDSDPIVVFKHGNLYARVQGVNISLEIEHFGKVKVNGVLMRPPVQLGNITVLHSGRLTRVVFLGTGVVVTYGGPDLIQVVVPASSRKMCGLCGKVPAVDTDDKLSPNGSLASDVSTFASSWLLSPSGTNCSEKCKLCSVCNSSTAAEFASDNLCGMLLAPAGPFSGCHSTVDPEPFFQNCVSDLCVSSGSEEIFCHSLSEYAFACQEAGGEAKPWRGERCSLLCPENSHYNICVSACPESCGVLSDIPCPWACYEGCQCDSGYIQSGNGCIKSEECGCFYHGQYYEIGEISWAEGCSERFHCSATATMCTEPASCPEGESCTLNNTWGCARKDNEICKNGKTCGVQSQPLQSQCWVLGGAHFYTFDGKMFEFQGNCTYTLLQTMKNTSDNSTVWVRIQKDRTHDEASAIKAILIQVAEYSVSLYRGEKGYVWINGVKRLPPVNLQFGLVKILHSGFFVIVDSSLGIQVKYDYSHIATVLLSNMSTVDGLCGNNNGIEDDDLRSLQGKPVDSTTFGWSWRAPDKEAGCTADCGDACPRCSAEQLQEKNVTKQWISLHKYIWSPQGPFYLCRDVVNYTKFLTAMTIIDLCTTDDPRKTLCPILEAYTAACQNAHIVVGEWRNDTNCSISCPLNSHFESCGTACPATCEAPFSSEPCILACVETCQCDPGFVLDGDICVPPSQCGCIHNGYRYHTNQTFWADERCTEKCFCDPHTHQMQCHVDSCGPDESCVLKKGVRSCVSHPYRTCIYSGHHIITFDQYDYDLHGTCQYQLLGMCGHRQGSDATEVHVQTDGHLESALQVLLNVSGVLVELNSKNTERLKVNGVVRNMPYHLGPSAVAYSLGLHTYIYTDMGFEISLSTEGIVNIRLSRDYANATCGLCGNFNSDPADDLTTCGAEGHLSPEQFGKAWRSGQNPWCVEGCLGGSCPKCSSERLALSSDPEACGKILEVNGPFRHCHGKVNPSSFYKRCVSDLCLHGGLQPALCHSLAVYTAVCLSHRATVYAWRSPGFCYHSCPSNTTYNMSSASVHLCLGLQNNIVDMPPNTGESCLCEAGLVHSGSQCVSAENCGCFHHGEYLQAGQRVSTCEKICLCNAGGRMTCHNVSCGEDEECKLLRGVQGCHPKPKVARCSLVGSQYTTFDGQAFEFQGSCNYTLVQTCPLKTQDVEPVFIAARGNQSEGRQIYLQVNKMYFKISAAFPGKIQVNGVNESLPFSRNNFTVQQKNRWITIKTPKSIELSSDLRNNILIRIPHIYHHKTCGLCGNYNDDPADDLQLRNGSVTSDPYVFGPSWKLSENKSSCSDTCDSTCQLCQSPQPKYTSDLYCGLLTHPTGSFSSCHHLVDPQKYYKLCMRSLCVAQGQRWALCDALWSYEAACEEAGGAVDLWADTTGCAHQCPQFSHYSKCANVCSLCPEISQGDQCPADCEEGCQCHNGHLYNDVHCPPNSHYKNCGTACPPSCEHNTTVCTKACVMGCFCDPGFIMSPSGCIRPHECGCRDSTGKYHSLNSTYWTPDNCGEHCMCGPTAGEVHCLPAHCPRGMVCKHLGHKRMCQPEEPFNCSLITGLHFTTFDGHHFDYRDGCSYALVQTKSNLTELIPFSINISDANCYKRLFHSLNLTLSVYGMEVLVGKQDPGKVFIDGLHEHLPYSHPTGHVVAYRTPSSLVIHTDVGLQVIVYNSGSLMVLLPKAYSSSVSGLCGNANANPDDDLMMPNGELAQNKLEFVHSWRSEGAEACRDNCSSRLKHCPDEAQKLFEGSDFCEVLLNELGPFADCASVLSPKHYFHSCVVDTCSYNGHYTALCSSIASYAAACQEAQLPVRHWRSDTFCGMPCPENSHYELCGPRCQVVCPGLSSPANCSGGCEEGCQCDPGYVLSDGQCVLVADCGCMHEGRYHPAGHFHSEKPCQKCICERGEVTCSPVEDCSIKESLALQLGVCQVFAGFGYITFDGVVLPHHGASTYLLSASQHSFLLLRFKQDSNGNFTMSRLVLRVLSLEVSINPDTLWKIKVNKEERSVPVDSSELKAYQDGHRLIIKTPYGLEMDLSSTQYLRITVPQVYNGTFSGLCGNFNGDRSDDMEMRSGQLTTSFAELLHSWTELVPGEDCSSTCGKEHDECSPSPHNSRVCNSLSINASEFRHCLDSGLGLDIYKQMCIRAVCAGAGDRAACLALEAFSAACRAKGIPVGPWREKTSCGLQCPDRSSPSICVDPSSSSCPALLQPGSPAAGCSESCQCLRGNVFEGEECVPYSQCGCTLGDKYIKMNEELYTENCAQRCWCHPLSGVLCEDAGCGSGQQCALRNGSWSCHDLPESCELKNSLHVSTLSGQQLILEPHFPYSLMSLCDEASVQWFSVISYHGPCDNSSAKPVDVFQILLQGSSITIQDAKVKVNGQSVSLPYVLPSGVSLTSGVSQDKSTVTVILRRDVGMESELEVEIGITMVTVKVPFWYSDKLCGLCGNMNDLHSHSSVRSWVLQDFPGCGFTG